MSVIPDEGKSFRGSVDGGLIGYAIEGSQRVLKVGMLVETRDFQLFRLWKLLLGAQAYKVGPTLTT